MRLRLLHTISAASLAACGVLAPARADQVLPQGRIVDSGPNSGDILFGALKLGRRQAGKTTLTPDAVQIQGSGSSGPVDGMSVTVGGSTQPLSAWLPTFAPKASPIFAGALSVTNPGVGTVRLNPGNGGPNSGYLSFLSADASFLGYIGDAYTSGGQPVIPIVALGSGRYDFIGGAPTIAGAPILASGGTGNVASMSAAPDAGAAENSLARLSGVALRRVASVTALRATLPWTGAVAHLTEAGREGAFAWTPGDYSYPVSIDTRGGVFVKADNVPASTGAWVRAGWSTAACAQLAWFGLTYSDDTAAIQAALSLVSNLQTRCLHQGSQRTFFSSTLAVPAGVAVLGNRAGQWKQVNGANLPELLTLGEGASLIGTGLDGNWTNNPTTSPSRVAIRIGASSNTTVRDNIISDMAGYPVVINGGKSNTVSGNKITGYYNNAIQVYGADSYDTNTIDNNEITGVGWGAINVANSSGNSVTNNRVTGTLIGGFADPLVVNTSGTTVTWVSGPKFGTLRKGNWVVYNGGKEARIGTVVSDTVLTTDIALDTLSNTPAHMGAGDLLGIVQGSFNRVTGNTLRGTSTFGFGYSLGNTAANCSNNDFSGNTLVNIGKNAINYSATVFNAGVLQGNNATGNTIVQAGSGGGNGASDRIAIYLQGVGVGSLLDTAIRDNSVTSYGGSGQTTYWLGTNGQLANGSVTVQGNAASGMQTSGIFGGVKSVTPSAAWGSTASVGGIVTDGKSVSFTLTANGSGLAAGGSVTVQKIVEAATDTPMPTAKVVNGSGYLPVLWGENQSTRGSWVAYQRDSSVPAAGQTFQILMKD